MYSYTNELYKPDVLVSDNKDYYPLYYYKESDDILSLKNKCEHIDNNILQFRIIGIETVLDIFTSDPPKIIE